MALSTLPDGNGQSSVLSGMPLNCESQLCELPELEVPDPNVLKQVLMDSHYFALATVLT